MFTFKSEFVVDMLKKNKGILWKSKIPNLKTLMFTYSRKALDILYDMKPIRIA